MSEEERQKWKTQWHAASLELIGFAMGESAALGAYNDDPTMDNLLAFHQAHLAFIEVRRQYNEASVALGFSDLEEPEGADDDDLY